MNERAQKWFIVGQWIIGGGALIFAVLAWWQFRQVGVTPLTIYDLFPLLGLVAFSLMWSHYAIGGLRRYLRLIDSGKDRYWHISSVVILICLLLHPILLSFGLWRDGFGLPPQSYLTVYDSMRLFIMLGSLAWLVFLFFEFHRWFNQKKWWCYVEHAQVGAMLAIFLHGLSLGGELSIGWFRVIWWIYAISLVGAYLYSRVYDKRNGAKYESR